MRDIIKRTSTHNTTSSPNRSIDFIVLHYTAGFSSAAGKAEGVASMFSTSSREASADFIVDDETIVQYNGDIKNRFCWSVGGSKYSNLQTSLGAKFYNKCTNKNSISIEMCSNKINKNSDAVTDDDWYLTDATIANAVELTKYLMNEYGIDADHVIMHHMVTGKWCPQPWVKNEAALSGWYSFKEKISGGAVNPTPQPAAPTPSADTSAGSDSNFTVKVLVDDLNIRLEPSMSGAIVRQTGKGVFTIIKVKDGWGLLKSRIGWIYLDNPKYVTKLDNAPTPAPAAPSNTYQVKVKCALNIRAGAGVRYKKTGIIRDNGVYTIVETKANWGKLASGAGWICLDYTTRL